jgi:hypothetical protein
MEVYLDNNYNKYTDISKEKNQSKCIVYYSTNNGKRKTYNLQCVNNKEKHLKYGYLH